MTRLRPLAIALGAAFGALVTLQPVSDSDLFWHVATGARTIAGDLPRTDAFSWTVAGGPVLTDQWFGDAILAAAHALAEWRGVLALRALAVGVLVAVIVDGALAARPRAPIVAAAAVLPAIALSRFAWTDRPELLALVCFAVLVRLLRGGDRELLLSIPLLLVWSQLHGSYALALALVLASCVARAVEERRERWRFVPIASAAIVATLIGPSGLATWTSSGGHFLAPPRFIAEEGVPDARTLPGLLFLGTLALVLATSMLARRVTLREAMLLAPVAFVALTAARHTPFLAVAAAPYFASAWPDPLAAWRSRPDDRPIRTPSRLPEPLGRMVVLVLGAATLAAGVGLADAKVDESAFPRGALAALPRGPGVMNQYDWGGYLIAFAPATPVFIDGRLFPFVPSVLEDYRAVIGARPGWENVVRRREITTMLVRPTDAIAARARERGWRVVYEDATAMVLAR